MENTLIRRMNEGLQSGFQPFVVAIVIGIGFGEKNEYGFSFIF